MSAAMLACAGFVAICADNAEAAWAHVPKADVVVTGIQIHGLFDGVELVRRVHQDYPAKPVIVLTAWADPANRRRAEVAGCDAFLVKPCPPDILTAEIRRLLALSHALRSKSDVQRSRAAKARLNSERLLRKSAALKKRLGE